MKHEMVEEKFFKINQERQLHYLHAGDSELKIILIHGGDRHFQNSSHWNEMLSWMSEMGEVFALDLLGHGKSIPGENFENKIPAKEQVNSLILFAQALSKQDTNAKLLWVGRSYGAYLLLNILSKQPSLINAMILIVPAIYPSQLEKLGEKEKEKPVLLFWAEDDPIVPWYRHKKIVSTFKDIIVADVGKVLSNKMERWRGHTPELVRPEEFKKYFTSFVQKINDK